MLKNLRLRLTLLYFIIGVLLVILLGGTTYGVLFFYFQNTSDQALYVKMASVFDSLGIPKTTELSNAQQKEFTSENDRSDFADEDEEELEFEDDLFTNENLIDYQGELASIFILPSDSEGNLLFNPNPYRPPVRPVQQAIDNAEINQRDLRTITISNGSSIRMLTYRIPGQSGIDFIQLGKSIDDQIRILYQFLIGLFILGGGSILLLGFASWWQAGRMLVSAQEAWDNQQLFIANASHELRAPLTIIRAASDAALRKNKNQPAINRLLDDIIQESDHMNHLVEDLLLLSRLDVGQLKMSHEEINLKEFAKTIQRHFQPLTENRGVDFQVRSENISIKGDQTRLHQVLLIILDNALQHTGTGGKINLDILSRNHKAIITVTDSGEGISPEHLEHIFERFYQVESDRRENRSGSGLGLSIAKSIVEAHGGTISVESEAGICTAIRIILPMEK